MAESLKITKPFFSRKHFRTPIIIAANELPLAPEIDNKPKLSVDEQQDRFLEDRKRRKLADAKNAELEVSTEADRRDATLIRKERERIENTENPEENEVSAAERAAEVAAEATAAGVDPKEAKSMATGKTPIIVVHTKDKMGSVGEEEKSRWILVNGMPVRDPDGMTWRQLNEFIEKQTKARLGWDVVDGRATPVEGGKMTFEQAKDLAAQERREREEKEKEKAEKAGDPDIKKLLQKLAEKEIEAKDAEIKSYREQTTKLIEHITSNKGNGQGKTMRALVLDETGKKYVFKEIPTDEPFIPPAIAPERNPEESEMVKIERDKLAVDKVHKEGMRKIAGDIGASIITTGATIAAAYTGDKISTWGKRGEQEIVKCVHCQFDIPAPPDWNEITCPKCKYILKKCVGCGIAISVAPGTVSFTCPNPKCNQLYNPKQLAPDEAKTKSQAENAG